MLLVRVALGQPLEAVVEADGRAANFPRLDDDRADDAVRARRGPAADEYADSFYCHISLTQLSDAKLFFTTEAQRHSLCL